MAKRPTVGERAPEFELDGTAGAFRLSAHLGERVILLFYPGDGTPVCTRQFCSYRDRPDELKALDAVVVGISSQDIGSHRKFSGERRLNVPLLCDPDGAVARRYGAHNTFGTKRAAIVIDEQGVVRYRHDHLLSLDYLSIDELAAALEALSPSNG